MVVDFLNGLSFLDDEFIIMDTPERRQQPTADLTAKPTLLPSSLQLVRPHIRARRSMSKPSAVAPDPLQKPGQFASRKGDYDCLNYAPISQNEAQKNQPTAILSAASQRARNMARMAVKSPVSQRPCLVSRSNANANISADEVKLSASFIFDDEQPTRPHKKMALPTGIGLARHEVDVLDEILMDLPKENNIAQIAGQKFQSTSLINKAVETSLLPSPRLYAKVSPAQKYISDEVKRVSRVFKESRIVGPPQLPKTGSLSMEDAAFLDAICEEVKFSTINSRVHTSPLPNLAKNVQPALESTQFVANPSEESKRISIPLASQIFCDGPLPVPIEIESLDDDFSAWDEDWKTEDK